jgi:hypothetical protein
MSSALLDFFLIVYILPVCFGIGYRLLIGRPLPQVGERSPASLLPPPSDPIARVRILFHRPFAPRGALGGHSCILFKRQGAPGYTRFDYDAEAVPLRNDGWVANEPAYGPPPTYIYGVDGPRAEAMIPLIEAAVQAYAQRHYHDYRRFVGPNSNTFIQGIIDAVPDMDAMLPPNALGKEYPHDGRWLRRTKTGIHITLGGYVSLRIGWIEGLELNLFCLLAGLDWRRPALKLPALGRLGMPLTPIPAYVPGSGRLTIGGGRGLKPGTHESGFTHPGQAGRGGRNRRRRQPNVKA